MPKKHPGVYLRDKVYWTKYSGNGRLRPFGVAPSQAFFPCNFLCQMFYSGASNLIQGTRGNCRSACLNRLQRSV